MSRDKFAPHARVSLYNMLERRKSEHNKPVKSSLLSIAVLIMAITVNPLFLYGQDEQISRYEAKMSEKDIICLFDGLAAYLSTSEDKRLLKLQQKAIMDLPNSRRYDEQYGIIVAEKESDIDLTTYYNKTKPELAGIHIAGPKEYLDPVLKTISMQCKVVLPPKNKM